MSNSNNNYLTSMLGFAQKAGKLSSGNVAVLNAVNKNKAKLVIIAEDISDNSIDKLGEKCKMNKIPIIIFGTKDSLGHYIGKELRAVVSVNDQNFAKSILNKWEGETL